MDAYFFDNVTKSGMERRGGTVWQRAIQSASFFGGEADLANTKARAGGPSHRAAD